MNIRETLRSSFFALRANRVRTLLTGLGLVIGNASVILVVTISLTSTDYILAQIRGLGSNVIWGYYEVGTRDADVADADFVKLADIEALRRQLGDRIVAATAVMNTGDRMLIGGREEDVQILGADEDYPKVRNLVVLAGRMLDQNEVLLRQKVAMLTHKLALRLYGSQAGAIGQTIKVKGIEFTVIGTFREKAETFGQSELNERTVVIPVSVVKYFVRNERIDPFYIQAKRAEDVPPLTGIVRAIIESRHRPGARYYVDNLGGILEAAENIGVILTIVLILVSAIALVISGIGIMNIMLVTVTERTKEIGLRMAVGASKREVMAQFLAEAVLISIGGGLIGIVCGLAVPLGARIALDGALDIRISGWSVGVAFAVSLLVGLVFGLLPAQRAAQLAPTEALRYE